MSARDSAPHAAIAIPAGAATLIAAAFWTLGAPWTHWTHWTLSGATGLAAEPSRLALALAGSLAAALLSGPFQDLALRGIAVAFPLAALVALPPPSGLLAALVLAGAVGLRSRPGLSDPLGRLASFGWALTRGGIGAGLATLALSVLTSDATASRFLLSQSELARDILLAAAALALIVATDALLAMPWPGDAPSHGFAPHRIAWLAHRTMPTMPMLPTILAMLASALMLGGLMAGAMREPGPGSAFAALAVITLCGADLARRLRGSFGATASAGAALASRDRTIAAMARATRTIAAQTDPDAIFQALGSACRALFETDLFLLASVDRDTRGVRVAYVLGPEPHPRTMLLPEGRGLIARALRSPHPTLIHDIRSEAPSLRAEAVVVEPRIRAILSAPLSEAGRVTGLVSVQAFRPHAYTEEDSERLVMLAALAAGRLAAAAGQTASGVDRLTGLVATDAFLVRLDEEIARGARYKSPVSVLRLAIDKDPTTTLPAGRTVRDQIVGAIGELVRATIRRSDLVCRSGSDEFGLILAQCDLRAALQAAERLRYEAAQIRIQHGALRLGLTVTIGASVFAAAFPTDAEALWDEAGSALAEATRLGGDRVVASRKAR